MSIIEGVVVGAETGFYPTEIEQSLRFNSADSAYLSWTPASAGNRKTWTFSTWVKRGNITGSMALFGAYSSSTNRCFIEFSNDGTTQNIYLYANNGTGYELRTSNLLRDPSAWYHVVVSVNTTSSNDNHIYINGVEATYASASYPALNSDLAVNGTYQHGLADRGQASGSHFDGYLAETHFIDGQALDATAFGEFKNGVWIPKAYSGSYGTNGFYLPYRNDYTVEGFSAVTWNGSDYKQYIGGVGFSPDLVWIKCRDTAYSNYIQDTIRGTDYTLYSDLTAADTLAYNRITSFDTDGFTLGQNAGVNTGGSNYVAWCWDAGTGSPVSNTDGSITSTVKANPSRGFSIVSYTGDGTGGSTIGHGLNTAPDMVIFKGRTNAREWYVYHADVGATKRLELSTTIAATTSNGILNDTAPSSSVITLGNSWNVNQSANDFIAYCFHSVAGYSKMGSYTGTGASGNTVTTGFKPALILQKRTDSTGDWRMVDLTRDPNGDFTNELQPNSSGAEYDGDSFLATDTGFEITTTIAPVNASGATYIYMAFADTREAAFWLDDSGNNNDWENNGLTESDISLDSPTNNFATLNPLTSSVRTTLSDGNLRSLGNSSAEDSVDFSTISTSSGQWYWEEYIGALSSAASYPCVGVARTPLIPSNGKYTGDSVVGGVGYFRTGTINKEGSTVTTVAAYTTGDVIGVALDADALTVKFYKNNTLVATVTGITASSYFASNTNYYNSVTVANFGQDSSFAGNKTPQGYTDANGRGDFYYAPPAGYLALCTANLPEPAIGPNSATTSDEHFNTVLYTGTGSASGQAITGVGFQPDFVWVKQRNLSSYHHLQNIMSGTQTGASYDYYNYLSTNATLADQNDGPVYDVGFVSFDSDGFFIRDTGAGGLGGSGNSYVAWNWKADNTSGSTNTDGTITSTVSANVDAGFSIVSWTGNGVVNTVGHGLSQAPELWIMRRRNTTDNWLTYYTVVDGTLDYMYLNLTNSASGSGLTPPTSTVFTDGLSTGTSDARICYAFHSVEGYSKFGSYTGNGSTDGTFVHLGFKPAFVIIKRTSATENWFLFDNKRDGYNVDNNYLYPDLSNAEGTVDYLDLTSNGFKCRSTSTSTNASGSTYIYMAFAENPFKYSNAR